jgi:hypothetical protein
MDNFDIINLRHITYVQSQIASFYAELEAMKAENAHRTMMGLAQAYGFEQFIKLQDTYQLGHNSVKTNLSGGI